MTIGRVIGIDPGKSGGIAVVWSGGATAMKMPTTEKDLWQMIEGLAPLACFTVIERVHSMPEQGVRSVFTFGWGYGGLRMALVAADIPFEEVLPTAWQRTFGLALGKKVKESHVQKKNRHKAKAQQLFPHVKVTHSVADALLIAEYGWRAGVGR